MAVSLNELRLAVSHRAGDEMAVTFVDTEEVVLAAPPEGAWSGAVFSFRVEGHSRSEMCFAWPVQVADGTIEIPVIFRSSRIRTAAEALRSAPPSGPAVPVALNGREIM
ncbi:MAG: hypothetical protein JWQ36_220 [Enterovirga sp.]|jgi:hypothetical protein|nr:hypothetical protein [Enterovirga sp.]